MVGPFQIRCQATTPFDSLTMNIRVAGWPNWSRAKLSVEPTRYALPSGAVATAVATSAPAPPQVVSVSKNCPCAGPASVSMTQLRLANSAFPVMAFLLS